MFYHKQDTGLLQCALVSAAKSHSGSLCDLEDSKTAVNIIYGSVKKIIFYNLEGITDEKESLKIQLFIYRRLHAAVFFTTLRSCGITSCSADDFYRSIIYSWPAVDLKFYMELNFKSQWSEYFIECASQLPPEALSSFLKKILLIPFPRHLKLYSWHLVLQTIILKLLDIPVDDEILPFNFDFCEKPPPSENINSEHIKLEFTSDKTIDEIPQHVNLLLNVYYILCDNLGTELEESNDIDLLKILMHALKTLMKNLNDEKCNNLQFLSEFVKISSLLNDCFKSSINLEMMQSIMNSCANSFVSHVYATTSWNISEVYLILILNYFKNSLEEKLSVDDINSNSTEVDGINSNSEEVDVINSNPAGDGTINSNSTIDDVITYTAVEEFIKEIADNYEIIQEHNPFFKDDFHEQSSHLDLLKKIIQFNFTGASFAVEILLSNPVTLEKNDIFKLLEENGQLIDVMKLHPQILKSIMIIKSPETRTRLLNFFYKLLSGGSNEIYNEVLENILTSYGLTNDFQLPDFDDQLSQVVRKTLAANEALEVIPVLFIENPKDTLKCIIEQGIVQGSGAEALIQVLEVIPAACTFQETDESLPLLIEILDSYFETVKLETYESKNMIILTKLLMEVQSKVDIMCLDLFINKCIIQNLQASFSNRILFVLECLEVTLNTLISSESFTVAVISVMSVITCLGQIIRDCIKTGNGKMKESVISVLTILEKYQKKSGMISGASKRKLYSYFRSLDEVVCLYVEEFLPEDIDFCGMPALWIMCCKNKTSDPLGNRISVEPLTYSSLLTTLVQVLPHFTKDEWLYSITLIKVCCKTFVEKEIMQYYDKPFKLSQCDKNLYAVVSCLITSLHFILPENIGESLHISSCFSSTLMTILSQEDLQPQLLLTIFFDVCHLISCISSELINVFTSTLLDLKQYIVSCIDEQSKNDYLKLINYAVKCLPLSEKSTLWSKINMTV